MQVTSKDSQLSYGDILKCIYVVFFCFLLSNQCAVFEARQTHLVWSKIQLFKVHITQLQQTILTSLT